MSIYPITDIINTLPFENTHNTLDAAMHLKMGATFEPYEFHPYRQPYFQKYTEKGKTTYRLLQRQGEGTPQPVQYMGHSQDAPEDYIRAPKYITSSGCVVIKKGCVPRIYTIGDSPYYINTPSKKSTKPSNITYQLAFHKDDIYHLPNYGGYYLSCDIKLCSYTLLDEALEKKVGLSLNTSTIQFDKRNFELAFDGCVLPFGYIHDARFRTFHKPYDLKNIPDNLKLFQYDGKLHIPQLLQPQYGSYNNQTLDLNAYVSFLSKLGVNYPYFSLNSDGTLLLHEATLDENHQTGLPIQKGHIHFSTMCGIPTSEILGRNDSVYSQPYYAFNYHNEFIPMDNEPFIIQKDAIFNGCVYPGVASNFYPINEKLPIVTELRTIKSVSGDIFLYKSDKAYNDAIYDRMIACAPPALASASKVDKTSITDIEQSSKYYQAVVDKTYLDYDVLFPVLADSSHPLFSLPCGILYQYVSTLRGEFSEGFIRMLIDSHKYETDWTGHKFLALKELETSQWVYQHIPILYNMFTTTQIKFLIRLLTDAKDDKLFDALRREELIRNL